MKNPDHGVPEDEMTILLIGFGIGWGIIVGSFVYLIYWWLR